ncbi:MAG: VOC family protein, partial [Enterobacter hormaechei]|nr:VOC family protein [Enterobacter hormaechei]
MPSSVRGIDHIGITVPDIEKATLFFERAFDAQVLYHSVDAQTD